MPDARAFWTVAAGRGEIRPEAVRAPGPGEALVRTAASGISRGTETLVFRGEVPEEQRSTMRAPFQAGGFPFPVKYGYSAVGVVEAGDPDWIGRRVFCLHPHQDRFVVPASALRPIPDMVPDARAVLAANLETAVNALWDAPVRVGDRLVVVGGGVIGASIALLAARHPGARVGVVEVDPERAARLRGLELDVAAPGELARDADLVVHASATAAGLEEALRIAGSEATVLEMSWYGSGTVQVPLGGAFHDRRLTLRSSQVGHLPEERRPRWTRAGRLDLALRLLADPVFDHLLEPPEPFERLPEVMAELADARRPVMCQVITYREPPG
ncbi:MAG TPA: zinc-binding alcohol dehydrogenase [Geminicoccaceae bacterium]